MNHLAESIQAAQSRSIWICALNLLDIMIACRSSQDRGSLEGRAIRTRILHLVTVKNDSLQSTSNLIED
jgi:hypothetical protein